MSTERFLSHENLAVLAQRLAAKGVRVVAPTVLADGAVEYRALESARPLHLDLGAALPRRSLKEFFLPPTEPLLAWKQRKGDVELTPASTEFPPLVVIGARPCDAAALPTLDRVMDWDYHDELWFGRRAAATVLALSCTGYDQSCFCTAVGLAPDATHGADGLLTPVAGGYVVAAATPRGEAFLGEHADLTAAATPELCTAAAERCAQARAQVAGNLTFDPAGARAWLDRHFDHPFWAQLALRCHGCGACAAVCPTCHCFDIVDEPAGLDRGVRRRNWDTCQAPKFTLHASGHNPRPEQNSRLRQRVLHKFAIYPDRFGAILCTGCGRCARACPGGMDLPETLAAVADLAAAPGGDRGTP